jgi:hypothetical protein
MRGLRKNTSAAKRHLPIPVSNSLRRGKIACQHCQGHHDTSGNHRDSPPKPIDDQHLDNRAPNLERRLDPADQQRKMVPQRQLLEQRGQVVLDRRRAAHLRHELQQRGAPEPLEQAAAPEQRGPVVAGRAALLDVGLDVGELGVDLLLRVAAVAVELEGFPGLVRLVVLDEPPGSAHG